jgi:hypothetical protein
MVLNISRVERAVTYVGLEIIGKLASVLELDPAEFFRAPPPGPVLAEGRLDPLPARPIT